MSRRWIRLDAEWDESGWLDGLTGQAVGCWPRLLCWVKLRGKKGRCKMPAVNVLARRWKVTTQAVDELMLAAEKDGAITIQGDELVVVKWLLYQEPDPTALERKRRQRSLPDEHVTDPSRMSRVTLSRDPRPLTTNTQTTTAPAKERKRKTQLPSDWQPTELHKARAKGDGIDCNTEVEAFRSYHESHGNTRLDWNASFTTWLINAKKFSQQRKAGAPPPDSEAAKWDREAEGWREKQRLVSVRATAQVGELNRLATHLPTPPKEAAS